MFHINLKNKRLACNFTQRYVAEYLNISPQSISKWESGSALPSIEFLPKLAECFDCAIDDLFKKDSSLNDITTHLTFWQLYSRLLDDNNYDEITSFVKENPNILNQTKTICDKIREQKIINTYYISDLLSCSIDDAKQLLAYFKKCELIEFTETHEKCLVIKHSYEGLVPLFKAIEIICELKKSQE